MTMYTDLFAGNLKELAKKLPYLKEQKLTYLHLMPLLQMPHPHNDGGYAVEDFDTVDPALGTPVVVQFHEQPFQFVLVLGKPRLKFLFCCHRSALHFRKGGHGRDSTMPTGGDAGCFVGKGQNAFQLFHRQGIAWNCITTGKG